MAARWQQVLAAVQRATAVPLSSTTELCTPRADMEATTRILKMYTVEQELAVERTAAWIRLRSMVAM